MKNILLLFSLSIILLSSCTDKCDSIDCNNGTCEDGTCLCEDGYEGSDCSVEVRAKFIGTWTGNVVCEVNDSNPTTVKIIAKSDNIQQVIIDFADFPHLGIVEGNKITFVERNILGSIITGNVVLNPNNEIVLYNKVVTGSLVIDCTFTGTK